MAHLVDRAMKTVNRGDAILIPVTTEPHFDLAPFRARLEEHIDLPHRFRPRDPRRELRERLSAAGIPLEHAPQRWERIGDVLVVRLPSEGQPSARLIAQIFGTVLGARTVVQDLSGIHGPMRVPDVRVLSGDGTETVHVEGGIRYAMAGGRRLFYSWQPHARAGVHGT